jgi:DNA-binding PadR family transcriptional regulator
MEKRGWIEAEWGVSQNNRRAKYYGLNGAGRRALEEATQEWARYSEAMAKVLASGA